MCARTLKHSGEFLKVGLHRLYHHRALLQLHTLRFQATAQLPYERLVLLGQHLQLGQLRTHTHTQRERENSSYIHTHTH